MVRHSLNIIKKCDQPTVHHCKERSVEMATRLWRGQVCFMFGGLHIELAALKTLGNLLKDSGWTSALVQAGVTTAGTADSFLKSSPHHPNMTCLPSYSLCLIPSLRRGIPGIH